MLKNDDNKSRLWLIMLMLKAMMKTVTTSNHGVVYYAPVTVPDTGSHSALSTTL